MRGWLACLAVVAACSNPTDHKQNLLPGGDAGGSDVALAGDASATGGNCDCLAPGQWFRFDTLQLESLNGEPHPITVLLNPLWQTDIDLHELNFYAEVTAVTADGVDIRVVNGARVGTKGDTCMLEYTSTHVHFPRKGCQLLLSDPAEMNVYAGTQATPKNCSVAPYPAVKHVIPIKKARLRLDMAEGCGKFAKGRLDRKSTRLNSSHT